MKLAMIRLLPLAAAVLACAPLETYYKPGAALEVVNRDTTACEVKALSDVPPSIQIRRLPPIYVAGKRVCNAEGACVDTPGYYVDGGVESYDANKPLRGRVEVQCMADKGYVPVSIPPCPDRVSKAAPAGVTTRLPALNEGSCVIRNRDGTFQIVTQG